MTRRSCLATGIALELALLREKTRWVLNSARTKRGKVASSVVSRCPAGETESARTLASNPIGSNTLALGEDGNKSGEGRKLGAGGTPDAGSAGGTSLLS